MRVALIATLLLSACWSPRVTSSRGGQSATMGVPIGDGAPAVVVVSVALCDFCSTPYEHHVKAARQMLVDKCGGGSFTLLEEGTDVSAGNAVYITPIPGGAIATGGVVREYYWIARCN